jgi:hypothetical protein
MDDAHEDRLRQHEDMLRSLTAMLVKQDGINERLTVSIEELKAINAGVQTTLARIETLLARMLRPEDNGRNA